MLCGIVACILQKIGSNQTAVRDIQQRQKQLHEVRSSFECNFLYLWKINVRGISTSVQFKHQPKNLITVSVVLANRGPTAVLLENFLMGKSKQS